DTNPPTLACDSSKIILPFIDLSSGALLVSRDALAERSARASRLTADFEATMKITDVRTVLLTGPCTNDPFVSECRKYRSAAFIEIHTDTASSGLGESYNGYRC